MKFILFNWDNITSDVNDVTDISDEEFMKLVEEDGNGHIYESLHDFESAFNAERFSSATHQLRIIPDTPAKMQDKKGSKAGAGTLVCEHCKGTNIETKAWVDSNTDEVLDSVSDGEPQDKWCRDCKKHVNFNLIFDDDEERPESASN